MVTSAVLWLRGMRKEARSALIGGQQTHLMGHDSENPTRHMTEDVDGWME